MSDHRDPEPVTEFRTTRRVEFADSDMGGIVHFSRYYVFMETAEHEFLNAIGTSVALDLDGRKIGWPRVATSCEYKSPARFGDTVGALTYPARTVVEEITAPAEP